MKQVVLIAGLMVGALPAAYAAHRTPVKPIDGYKCMVFEAPESEMMNFKSPASFKAEPSETAANIAPIPVILATDATTPETNGFLKSMNFAFKTGWVATKWVKPYSEVHPGVSCTPYVMNDGKLGFVFNH